MKIVPNQLKYQQIEAEIRQLAQTLPLGAKLPAERDLAITYHCNFLTVRKALKRLVDDGLIVRRVGSGTFIARHAMDGNSANGGQRANRIGILVYQGSNAYAYRILQSLSHASIEQNIDLRSIWVRDFNDDAMAQMHMLKKDQCGALTLPWFPHDKVEDVRRFVVNCPLPVSLPLVIPGLEKNCFERHDIFGALSTTLTVEDTCRYYRELGHDRIALIGPDSSDDLILQRKISGYVHYTSRENLPSLCGLVGPGAQAMDRLAERWKEYRGSLAIICYDDEHALRFITAMHKIGLNAPDDFSIIGYNDTDGSKYSDPPLTTIHQNFDYIGHWLLKSARAMANGRIDQSTQTPRLKMLVRDSCGGKARIDDAFRAQFQYIDIITGNGEGVHENFAPEAAPVAPGFGVPGNTVPQTVQVS